MKSRTLFCLLAGLAVVAFYMATLLEAQEPAAENPDEIITVVYKVPPNFVSVAWGLAGGGGGRSDPFGDLTDNDSAPLRNRESGKGLFESAGIPMPSGAAAIHDAAAGQLIVSNTRDNHELVRAYLDSIVGSMEKQIQIIVEFIEVEHFDFSEWLLSNHFVQDGNPLRQAAQEWVREGRGEILQTATILARSGQRAKVESISEYIYPTEFDPPVIPEEVTVGEGSEAPITDFTPTAFETRNLGITLEVDPVLGADEVTIDLNLAPEVVELEGSTVWSTEDYEGGVKLEMPQFYAMKVTTQVTLHKGTYQMIGTTRPLKKEESERDNALVLVFVRADVSSLGQWSIEEGE